MGELSPSRTTWNVRGIVPQKERRKNTNQVKSTNIHDILKCSALPPDANPEIPPIHAIQKLASHTPTTLYQSTQSSQQITCLFCYSPLSLPPSDLEERINHLHFNVIFSTNVPSPNNIWI